VAGGRAAKTQPWQQRADEPGAGHLPRISIPPNLLDDKGVLTITFVNLNDTSLLFPIEDGMEVLYPEGGFALNFARGLGIIFAGWRCWRRWA
jgi:hypothetical protein